MKHDWRIWLQSTENFRCLLPLVLAHRPQLKSLLSRAHAHQGEPRCRSEHFETSGSGIHDGQEKNEKVDGKGRGRSQNGNPSRSPIIRQNQTRAEKDRMSAVQKLVNNNFFGSSLLFVQLQANYCYRPCIQVMGACRCSSE